MKVLVIGGSGRTGGHAMQRLLARGDSTTALVRKPEAMTPGGKLPAIVRGDARDAATIERAIMGQDAVLIAFGPRASGRPEALTYAAYQGDLQEVIMRNVIAAMQKHAVKRLLNLSSWALKPALLGFVDRRIVLPLLASRVLADKARGETLLFASGLDYVNVRPGRLLDGPARSGARASEDGRGLMQIITREDLAEFMVRQLTGNAWVRQSPFVGY
jgi:uncharacterized protein YbjT (DUF2867 family)